MKDCFPDISLTFIEIPDIFLTCFQFPNISRFSRQVVTLNCNYSTQRGFSKTLGFKNLTRLVSFDVFLGLWFYG